jgi:nitrate reductase gamma subunit
MLVFFFLILAYLSIAVFIGGHVWRYHYDKFGWTTRSSQLYEGRLLRLGSPLFHFGILLVAVGHIVGLLVPRGATAGIGMSDHIYHLMAASLGTLAGVMAIAGAAILIYRRRTTGPVFSATTRNDKAMYVLLMATIFSGMANTVIGDMASDPHNYRETVAPYFRSIFYFQPHLDLIDKAPVAFQIHVVLAWLLFAFWPFTRLVHVFSAPLGYLTRPYIVYRSHKPSPSGQRPVRRGWEPVAPPKQPSPSRRSQVPGRIKTPQ